MKIEIKGIIEASPLVTSVEEIKTIIENALKENICNLYSIEIETEEV